MLSVLSLTSVSVALPVIATSLQVEPAVAVWVINGFQLALISTLFPFSSLGEQWGYRRVFLSGIVLIGAASTACALSDSFAVLVCARVVQGLGASAVMAVNPALIRLSVPKARLGWAIGLNAMIVAIATALGPSVAALVLSVSSWPWLFALNLPWAVMALAVGAAVLPNYRAAQGRRFDRVGALLNVAMFVLIVPGVDALASRSWVGAPLVAAGMVCAVALFAQQRRERTPLFPLDLLRIPAVRLSAGASAFAFAAQMAALVTVPFLLINGFGRSMVDTGLIVMAWPVAVALMAPVAAWCEERIASAYLCAIGGGLLAASLLVLAMLPGSVHDVWLGLAMVLCGIGFGCFQTPNNRTMIHATPRERSGAAGGVQATARLIGQTLGTSVTGISFHALNAEPTRAAALALVLAAGFALLSGILSLRRHGLA